MSADYSASLILLLFRRFCRLAAPRLSCALRVSIVDHLVVHLLAISRDHVLILGPVPSPVICFLCHLSGFISIAIECGLLCAGDSLAILDVSLCGDGAGAGHAP